jgi:hypothetical protein
MRVLKAQSTGLFRSRFAAGLWVLLVCVSATAPFATSPEIRVAADVTVLPLDRANLQDAGVGINLPVL